ncbi:MAG TPA: DUF29 domain-containing protein [Telluria sp.]|nr:DUF29 domain-containing protein [Telluria sp.]
MGIRYQDDVLGWAGEQAALLRARRLDALDLPNIAEEIEDVGKSAQREVGSRLSVLLAHLLKWQFQPERRSKSWQATIRAQRTGIAHALHKSPSLRHLLDDEGWLEVIWQDAVALAQADTSLDFPDQWAWALEQVLDPGFWPD